MKDKGTLSRSLLLTRLIPCGIILLWSGIAAAPAGEHQSDKIYSFPAIEDLPDNPMMPDPFSKPDGTRVNSLKAFFHWYSIKEPTQAICCAARSAQFSP